MRSSGPEKGKAPISNSHLFLGGHDLEMDAIRELGLKELGVERVHDRKLSWGAKPRASAYAAEIAAVLNQNATPVLVELVDDLGSDIDRNKLVIIDHHGELAGADRPCSLRQVFDLFGLPASKWTRNYRLIAANDIGHMRALRKAGATAEEIRAIRDADRSAQGVTPEDEGEARRAINAAEWHGELLVIRSQSARTSPILDFLETEYGGSGASDVLVLAPATAGFYGRGDIVEALSKRPGSWWGGALPDRGFWGIPMESAEARKHLQTDIMRLLTGTN